MIKNGHGACVICHRSELERDLQIGSLRAYELTKVQSERQNDTSFCALTF
jgi:hypothetical protein